jgi:hypothetical protein
MAVGGAVDLPVLDSGRSSPLCHGHCLLRSMRRNGRGGVAEEQWRPVFALLDV